ncbi:Zinc finger, ZZ-type [Phytophthora cactorum]|nr:Zinc finger, ZZ-type [Phytophthora cactorum]
MMVTLVLAPNVHKGASCRKCKTKPIRCERYRCVQCKNVDLCARCFKSNTHLNHAFVMKQNVPDPWIPALRENQPRTAISSDLIRDLESRELSTSDYDVLLQLDHAGNRPIQDYLVKVISGTKVSAESAKTFGESGATCSLCAQSLRIKAALHSTLCGVRAVDFITIVRMPVPGCDHALLPGLLYLQQKHEKSKTQQLTEPKQESQTPPTLNASFTVLGLQQQQHSDAQSPRIASLRVSNSRTTKRQHSRREGDEVPLLPGPISVGPNQSEHENIASRSSSRTSTAERSTLRTKGKLAKQSRIRNTLPPLDQRQGLPSYQSDNNGTEARLNHAERIRVELKAVERERLRKQRLIKEERRQRHKEDNHTPVFTGSFLGADQTEDDRIARVQVVREQYSIELKRKSKERHQHAREQKQLPITLPDLFVGNMSK